MHCCTRIQGCVSFLYHNIAKAIISFNIREKRLVLLDFKAIGIPQTAMKGKLGCHSVTKDSSTHKQSVHVTFK